MIIDRRKLTIKSFPETVFEFIEEMSNKFYVYKMLEIKPFLFLRFLFVDDLHSAIHGVKFDNP